MTRYCLHCDDGTVLVHERRDIEIEHRNHRATVRGVSGWHCPACGEIEFDPGEGERYNAALNALAESAATEDAALLRSVRQRLGLTQKAAEALTGGGHNAFSRYERGEARPMPAVMNLFRLRASTRSCCANCGRADVMSACIHEHMRLMVACDTPVGSSPHTRGTRSARREGHRKKAGGCRPFWGCGNRARRALPHKAGAPGQEVACPGGRP